MLAHIRKAIAAGIASGLIAAIFAAVSDGTVTPEEIAAIFGTVFGVGGLTWKVRNAPAPVVRP